MGTELGNHDELASCPLCGGEACATQRVEGQWGESGYAVYDVVVCTTKDCGMAVGYAKVMRGPAAAREAWNRRPE